MKNKLFRLFAVLILLLASASFAGCQVIVDAISDLTGGKPKIEDPVDDATDSKPEILAPAGWEKYEGDGFLLCLPEDWSGGSAEEFDLLIAELKLMGSDYAEMAAEMEANKTLYKFWAINVKSVLEDQVAVNCNIVAELCYFPLEDYMEEVYKMLEQFLAEYEFFITDQKIVPLGSHDSVGRTVYNLTMFEEEMTSVQYMIKNNNVMWYLTFVSETKKFGDYEKTFDQIVETFTIR